MSVSAAVAAPEQKRASSLWWSQTITIFIAELRKNFITKRGFWIYGLAALPVAANWMHSLIVTQRPFRTAHTLSKDTEIFAAVFQAFFLRPAVFFGCVGIFTYLFRGEVVQRSLHYYFLAPVRRSVLLLAKYAAGVVTACFFFGTSISVSFAGIYAHFPSSELQRYLQNGGYRHLAAYLAITVLACVTYGAVFLYAGIRWRNPIVPAIVLIMWESLNLFLPSWLKKVSILYYLRSMTPVSVPLKGPAALFAAVADPVSGSLAAVSLIGITCALLFLANRALERTEISYSSD